VNLDPETLTVISVTLASTAFIWSATALIVLSRVGRTTTHHHHRLSHLEDWAEQTSRQTAVHPPPRRSTGSGGMQVAKDPSSDSTGQLWARFPEELLDTQRLPA
jgi:hypothetical protein